MKYIDADKLIAEIERRLKDYWELSFHNVKAFNEDSNVRELKELRSIISSLQQEQPEVDLEKEIEVYFKGWTETDEGIACHYQYVDLNTCRGIARYFYELGLNARKEE